MTFTSAASNDRNRALEAELAAYTKTVNTQCDESIALAEGLQKKLTDSKKIRLVPKKSEA